ncbi:ATP-grasp enzyme [Actinomycetospora sp. CA-084318]|uniref:ATP-grasp enzyme n=1 Tax=Actinomycetospora sp. CA-084318 TaxID=3239892 RepID=UPI003D9677DB
MHRVARSLGMQALLAAALPANLAVTAGALLYSAVVGKPARERPDRPRTVLVSGGKMTKALALARAFHAAGHRVVLVEAARYRWTGHRFSGAVDAFHVVPPPSDPGYAQALVDVVRAEGVDVYVPVCSPASSWYDALAKPLLEQYCEVVHGDADDIGTVDDKGAFAAAAADLGLPVPDTHRVTSADEVAAFDFPPGKTYVLKSIPYDSVNRLDLTPLPRGSVAETRAFAASKPMSAERPWILQEFVRGTEYCTHGTARDGVLTVYCCCASSAFQLNYDHVDVPAIEEWVTRFVADRKLTGQYSFDFIVGEDGAVRAIECNPRTHSAITMFYDQEPELSRAYLSDDAGGTLRPTPESRPTYWLYQELWRLLSDPASVGERLRTLWEGTDAIFSVHDPLPFLLVHHLQIPSLLIENLLAGRDWVKIDVNIGKLVEPGGD